MLTKLLKSTIYIIALAAISAGGAILMHSVFAYTGPSAEPPDENVSVISTSGWTTSGTDVFLSTLTDYVGIGTNDPNKQLHLKTASGNAELDIQSGSQNYWAVYQDETTEQLRFWNSDFAGNIGPGVGNVFVIDNDGTVLVKTPVDGDSDNTVATKGYVDAAAGGGGDATLANQEAIMGSSFNTADDSLKSISDKVDSIGADTGGLQWAGYTGAFTGELGGVKGMNAKCQASYSGSHACTWDEIIKLGTSYPWTSYAWVVDGSYSIYKDGSAV
ncbi:MAG: hypothetical protein WC323_03390, partial [Patescibacteria group bacterium]